MLYEYMGTSICRVAACLDRSQALLQHLAKQGTCNTGLVLRWYCSCIIRMRSVIMASNSLQCADPQPAGLQCVRCDDW